MTSEIRKFPPAQRVECAEDLERIEFVDDMAEIDVPIEALDLLPFKNEERVDSDRLEQVVQSIRDNGYSSLEPVVVRLGRRGRWVIVDGGHRVTAARRVSKEFFTNLFGQKVQYLQFILHRTPLSLSRIDEPEDDELEGELDQAPEAPIDNGPPDDTS